MPGLVLAQSSSTNYILWDTSINGGGGRTTSTNYIDFNTVVDIGSDYLSSGNYRAYQGFEAITEEPRLTMSLSSTSITLSPNPLTTASVSTGATTVTVSTNADFGYALTATENAAFQNQSADEIADVSDGAVTAGSEEYGIAVSGADAAFGDDRSVSTTPRTIASKSTWGAARATVVTVKAAIASVTDSGEYAGTITFIATGNY
ncbi:hypothetical protein A2856_01325 [Candidatus Uhrbacteria bacterium RIFCSPHIGHO2_01_FULL_63_20]|uniref:Uncharacterized protein n=1 Tax=Candidatus Uhrbacteria bacterium RIFCSPHIGHO2_01_FULL_63_20 TaxID=1802385 RepID=A0A1F7TNX6_9BACT|nr:MAG: hypothetical protein A2856_01325 [Candidatus Uhrbacteria bacterium RIFCSPHIGHO2_01_FULL_63_20]